MSKKQQWIIYVDLPYVQNRSICLVGKLKKVLKDLKKSHPNAIIQSIYKRVKL